MEEGQCQVQLTSEGGGGPCDWTTGRRGGVVHGHKAHHRPHRPRQVRTVAEAASRVSLEVTAG